MILNTYDNLCDDLYGNLCDDWGWFIDIDDFNYYKKNKIFQPDKSFEPDNSKKKINKKIDKLQTIEEYEDEYDYYQKNHKNMEENYDIKFNSSNKYDFNKIEVNKNDLNKNEEKQSEDNIYSTTLLTAFFAYVIFIVL
jgi:hypothetical protein